MYAAGTDVEEAVATSLSVVGVTSAVGVVTHAHGGRVRRRTGVPSGAAGAHTGGRVGGDVPDLVLAALVTAVRAPTESSGPSECSRG
ncbi:anion permease [Streptomyces sp. SCSIO 75703]|uniref:anion permease n=1 Tax=unclassified Streptomyces TaxID=2593676 RepID=UPI0004C0DBFB|nr:anion permease [Streptomyces sp. NRRL F-5065]